MPVFRSEPQKDPRSLGAGYSPSRMCRTFRTLGAGCKVRSTPGDLRSPGADSSPALGALQAFQIFGTGRTVRSTRQDLSISGAGNSAFWMCCRPSRILRAGRTVRAPGRSPKPRSRQFAGPGCSAASQILGTGHTVRAPSGISQSQEQAARRPWMLCSLPDPRRRPHSQRHQGALRISDTCSTVRAPGRSPKPGSGQLAGLDALQPPGSSSPATQSETPGNPLDLRHPQHGQSTRQISEAQERAARRRWVRCRLSRILDVGRVAVKLQEAAQALESCPEE